MAQSDSPDSSVGSFLSLLFHHQHLLPWTSSDLETLNHDPEGRDEEEKRKGGGDIKLKTGLPSHILNVAMETPQDNKTI